MDIAGTVYRVNFALVMIYTHLGMVLRGILAGLVIFSLSMELLSLVYLSHCLIVLHFQLLQFIYIGNNININSIFLCK